MPHGLGGKPTEGTSGVEQEPANTHEAVPGPDGVARKGARSPSPDAASLGRVDGPNHGLVRQSQVGLEHPVISGHPPLGCEFPFERPAISGGKENIESGRRGPGKDNRVSQISDHCEGGLRPIRKTPAQTVELEESTADKAPRITPSLRRPPGNDERVDAAERGQRQR